MSCRLHTYILLALLTALPALAQRPQEPQRPYPYTEEQVRYAGVGDFHLAGTLTLPPGEGPFPAAVLISGSGPQDRDEALAGHRPFLVLADHLTRRGIAVLRYDDRGSFGSTGDFDTATTEDFADDALSAVAFLQGHAAIDPGQIGLIGHSEGGLIAPMAAAQSPDVAYIVLLAGPGLPGEQILHQQQALIARALGAGEEDIALGRTINEAVFTIVKAEPDDEVASQQILETIADLTADLSPADQREIRVTIQSQLSFILSPWYRFFLTYDPAPTLRQVKVPTLAIIGSTDLQVPPEGNLEAIEAALQAGGNPDHTVLELPNLNHLFQNSASGSPAEYAQIEETFAPSALTLISDWITARTGPATAVVESHTAGSPTTLSLAQNNPNPFNSQTTIRYTLPQATAVELQLFNAAGQQVATLAQGRRPAGTHVVRWDGRDDHGRPLATGVYFYTLKTGDRLESRRLTLLR